jgi:hypothetical protein
MDFELDQKFKSAFTDRYIPAPSKPEKFDDEVSRITGGRGRCVWGCDVRMDNRPDLLKYAKFAPFGIDRWVFEVKINMDAFPRDEWERDRYKAVDGALQDVLGPYPNQMWGMKMPLMDFQNNCGYMPCDERFLEWLRRNHHAWMTSPQGKFASVQAYRKMVEDMELEQKTRNEETERNADEIAEYCNTNREKINAGASRHSVLIGDRPMLITPDGRPWSSDQVH